MSLKREKAYLTLPFVYNVQQQSNQQPQHRERRDYGG